MPSAAELWDHAVGWLKQEAAKRQERDVTKRPGLASQQNPSNLLAPARWCYRGGRDLLVFSTSVT